MRLIFDSSASPLFQPLKTALTVAAVLTGSALALATAVSADAAPATPAKAAPTTTIRKPPPPDYFPLRYKYWWKYETKTSAGAKSSFKVTDIHDGRTVDKAIWHELETDTGNMIIHDWYLKSDGMVVYRNTEYVAAKMKADFLPERKYIKIVLNDGDTWQWSGKGMMGVAIDETSTVSGPEDVEVPAGKFKAMKVVTKVTQGGAPCTKTYWYGPNVGLVKSRTEVGSMTGNADFSGTAKAAKLVSDTELQEYQFPKLEKGELEEELDKNQDSQ